MGHARELSAVIEQGLARLTELPVVANFRGEGVVWGLEWPLLSDGIRPRRVAAAVVEACYRGDESGRAIHLLGPLAGKVLRISPPLVMPLDEAVMYLGAMYEILAVLGQRLQAS